MCRLSFSRGLRWSEEEERGWSISYHGDGEGIARGEAVGSQRVRPAKKFGWSS